MTREELLRDLDVATKAGDMELARAIDKKLSSAQAGKPEFDALEGMPWYQRLAAGAGKRMMDIATLGLREAPESDARLMSDPSAMLGGIGTDIASLVGGGAALKGVASVAGAAPKIANALKTAGQAMIAPKSVAQAGAVGGAYSALTTPGDAGDRIGPAASGALFGGAGYAAPKAIGALIKPNVADDVADLASRGIRMTPGQMMGGAWNRTEQKAMSLPIVGDLIKRARSNSLDDFNRAAFNEALSPIGAKLDAKPGRELVRQAYDKIEDAYNKIVPKLRVANDIGLDEGIAAVRSGLDPEQVARFDKLIGNKVLPRFDADTGLTGKAFKQVESELKSVAREWKNSAMPSDRNYADAVLQLRDVLVERAAKYTPKRTMNAMAKADEAYAKLERVAGAAGMVGAKHGVISPAQLLNQSAAKSGGPRRMQFRKGEALMQDIAEKADPILSTNFPNSGTTDRLLLNLGVLGGGAMLEPNLLLALGAGSAAYSPPARAAAQWLLTHQPQSPILLEMAQRSRQIAPGLGLLGIGAGPSLVNAKQ